MSISGMDALVSAVCEAHGLAPADPERDEEGRARFSLMREGVEVTFVQPSAADPQGLQVLVEYGPLPQGQEVDAMKTALGANLMMPTAAKTSFSLHPRTGHLVLRRSARLDDLRFTDLRDFVEAQCAFAHQWRLGSFLPQPASEAS